MSADAPPERPRWASRKLWFAMLSMGCAMYSAHAHWIDGQQLVSWATYTVLCYVGGNVGQTGVEAVKALAQVLVDRKAS